MKCFSRLFNAALVLTLLAGTAAAQTEQADKELAKGRAELGAVQKALTDTTQTLEKSQADQTVLLLSAAGEAMANDDGELKSLLEKVSKAAGGNKVANAKAWTQTIRFKDPKLGVATHRQFVELPDKFRSEVEFESDTADGKKKNTIIDIVNGDKGWQTSVYDGKSEGTVKSDTKQRAAVRWQVQSWGVFLPLTPTLPGVKAKLLGESKVEGRAVVGVGTDRGTERLYYDKETSRLVRQEVEVQTKGKKRERTVITFDDYGDLDGVPIARKQIAKRDGKVVTEMEVVEFKTADKLDLKLFEKP